MSARRCGASGIVYGIDDEAHAKSRTQDTSCDPGELKYVAGPDGADTSDDEQEIRRVVMEGYVVGIHGNGDRPAVRTGFHPDFVMKVLGRDGAVANVTI